ncbi:telomere-associated protein Tap [Streptomyces sp. NPDC058495]|uniref:telomere-associated protein Tap n=1 Tax=unclassified Streptomyces TaxID=2593676 RepID=UPI0036517056
MGTNQNPKTPDADALFAAADALLAEEPQLPPPAERARLREAAGITQARLATALQTTTQTVKNWENGRTEPKPPRLEAYQRILDGWAAKYPAYPAPAPQPAPAAPAAFAPAAPAPTLPEPAPAVATPPAPAPAPQPVPAARPATSRRPAAPKAAPAASTDPRFRNGPLVVLDGDGTAYDIGGRVLDCPAGTVVDLVEWAFASHLGAPRLHRNGRDSDPLVVLTPAAAAKLGLPERLEGHEQRRSLRLPEDHPVVQEVTQAGWQLTRRGFGPWPRIYRTPQGGTRQCVQLAVLSWDALDDRSWPGVTDMDPADIARALGTYAQRVLTPRGATAVCGLELMTALRPPTRAVRDKSTNAWVSGHNPGSLGKHPMDPAPPEAITEHPVAQGWNGGFLDEEAYQWVRPVDLLTGPETALPYALGLDLNAAFLAAAARLAVGLSAPEHVHAPQFSPKTPGSWLADLSHIETDLRMPSPFTPDGTRPTGPAWYRTHTLAYAQELGHDVHPTEAYLRHETGAYLDPWHERLKTAYLDTLADLGVTRDMTDAEFLAAMEHHKQADPALTAVLAAIKATIKGGLGKLRERPQGKEYRDGERWPALERPTWRPDIRADIISKARVNMHRKMRNMAALTGLFPLAVLSDCVVYPSPGASPLDLLPRSISGKPQGGFRLGPTPGLAKLEGVQPMAWAVDLMEHGYNPARHIKGDGHDAVLDAGE